MLCAQQHRWVVMRHSACFFFFFFFYNKENMSSSKRHCQVTSFSHHKLCTSHVDEWNTLLGGMFNLFTEWKHHFLSQTTTAGTDSNKAQHPAGKKGAFKTQQICHQLNHLTFKKKKWWMDWWHLRVNLFQWRGRDSLLTALMKRPPDLPWETISYRGSEAV